MHAGLLHLGRGIVAGIGAGARAVGNRVAPRVEQIDNMAFGYQDFIGGGCRNADEAMDRPGGATGTDRQAGERDAGGGEYSASHAQCCEREQAAAERVGQRFEYGIMCALGGAGVEARIAHGCS